MDVPLTREYGYILGEYSCTLSHDYCCSLTVLSRTKNMDVPLTHDLAVHSAMSMNVPLMFPQP